MYRAAAAAAPGGGTCAPSATCAPGGVVAAYWRWRRARAQCAGKSIRTLTAILTSPFLSWKNFPVALCLLSMYFYVKVAMYYVVHKYVYCITCTFFLGN